MIDERPGKDDAVDYRTGTPYLFNGKELDEETGLYYYGARYYDPKISMWYGVDPMMEDYPMWSPYNYTFNNPIVFSDPTGMYPIYGESGEYLGDNGESGGGDLAFTGQRDGKGGFKDLVQFTDNHTQFQTSSNIVKQEGTTSNADEYLWIAHTANNAANNSGKSLYGKLMTGYSSVGKKNKTALSTSDNSYSANAARAAVIDVLSGGGDVTGGASFWDGTDFLAWGLNSPNGTPHNKFEEYSSITIVVHDYLMYESAQKEKWGNSVRYGKKRYSLPAQVFKNESNWNINLTKDGSHFYGQFHYSTGQKGKALISTGSVGESIFWRVK